MVGYSLAEAELNNNLPKDRFLYKNTFFGCMPLVTRKGVCPYEYTNSWEKCEWNQLPSKECYYISLNDSNISDKDYEHACKVLTSSF